MNEKRKKAVALNYSNTKQSAPKITATGKGLIADKILEKAKAHQVPIVDDASLVELLGELDINQTIPEELYQAVAEVFAYIYKTDRKSTRLNSSHVSISYAVFCLKKKNMK